MTRTIRVRIAVAVTAEGEWNSCGWRGASDREREELAREPLDYSLVHWIEATIPVPEPVPEPVTVEGEVVA